MFFLRRIGNLVRGQSTFQIYSACVLGSMLGFVPGWHQAPGLLIVLLALLVILNANLFLAAVVGVLARILFLFLLPVLFQFGIWLVDGPPQPMLAPLANAPVLAWFGFEYYVVTAGLVLSPLLGLALALTIHRQIIRVRRRLAGWEHNSESFRQWSRRWWVKVIAFIFVGGTRPAKGSWEEALHARWGNPLRPLGLVLVLVTSVLLWISLQFFDSAIITTFVRSALERANGATVDVGQVELSPTDGRLTIRELEMADPQALHENLFEAGVLEADASGISFLTRKWVIDRIEVTNAATGTTRKLPGKSIGPQPESAEPPPETRHPDVYSIEEILAEAEIWKERLARVAEWLRKIAPEEKPEDDEERARGWRERLEDRARRLGYAEVASEDLIRQSPRIEVREVVAHGVRISRLPGELINFEAHHLSTQPWLLERAPRLVARAQSERFELDFLGTGYSSAGGANTLNYQLHDIAAETLASLLRNPGRFPVKQGTFSIVGSGSLLGLALDLPLNVTLRDARVVLPGLQEFEVASMQIPAALKGTIAAPALEVDASAFQSALAESARGRLRQEAQERVQDAVGEETINRLRRLLRGGSEE